MPGSDTALYELATRQHGLVTPTDARLLGFSRMALRHRIARGDWILDGPRVLRRSGSPATPAQRLLAAVYDAGPGAHLSHGSAAAWWGLPGFDLLTLDMTRPRGITATTTTRARLHTVVNLRAEHVTVLDGVPIVRPERLVLELCAVLHPGRAARAFDSAWSRRLLSGPSTRTVLDELAASGRAGVVALRQLLDERGKDYVPPATNLESRAGQILADAGYEMRRQVDSGGERWVGRVDLRCVDLPVVVEVQSERYHTALCDRVADARRLAALRAAGFGVAEVWDVDVWHHPTIVVEEVAAARRLARSRA